MRDGGGDESRGRLGGRTDAGGGDEACKDEGSGPNSSDGDQLLSQTSTSSITHLFGIILTLEFQHCPNVVVVVVVLLLEGVGGAGRSCNDEAQTLVFIDSCDKSLPRWWGEGGGPFFMGVFLVPPE